MIIHNGEIITSGGPTAFVNLVLYLVERFGGHERANLAAKVLLVDGHRPSQLPYIAFSPRRSHDDLVVHEVQQHLDEPLRVGRTRISFRAQQPNLVATVPDSDRSGSTGDPQHMRVQHAKRLLENTNKPVGEVRGHVGYWDPAAFRRAFKDGAGLPPSQYRRAYGVGEIQTP
jgi:transcriptional regulator GlxA family with amidase domain